MTSQDFRRLSVILESIRKGSRDSFAQIYKMYEKKVYFLFCKLVGNKAEAAKLSIDLFDYVYVQISNFSDPTDFEKWLYITVFARAKRSEIAGLTENAEDFIDAETDESLEIDELLAQDADEMFSYPEGIDVSVDMMKTADRIISQLPLKLRIAVLCHYFCGFETEDIRAIEQITEGEVKNRLFKARLRMKTEEHKFTELGYDCMGLVVFLPDVLSTMSQNIVMAANVAAGVSGRTGVSCVAAPHRFNRPTPIAPEFSVPSQNTLNRPTEYAVPETPKHKPSDTLTPAMKIAMGAVAVLIIIIATVVIILGVRGAKNNSAGSVDESPDAEVLTTIEVTAKETQKYGDDDFDSEITTRKEVTTEPDVPTAVITTEEETTTEEVTTEAETTTEPETTTEQETTTDEANVDDEWIMGEATTEAEPEGGEYSEF